MALIKFTDLGKVGLNKDRPSKDLPPEWFTDSRNVRFREGKIVSMGGEEDVFGTALDSPMFLQPWRHATDGNYWFYCHTDTITRVSGTTHTNVTPTSAPTGGTTDYWSGGNLGGQFVLNNGVDDPWAYNHSTPKFDPLSNWSTWPGTTTTCKILRPFKNYLIALDVTEDGTRNPHQVTWSTPADPGSLPTSWDYSSATNQAGRVELGTEAGILIDCRRLGEWNVIYKSSSCFLQQEIGGTFVFQFSTISDFAGILAPDCMAPIPRLRSHLVLSQDDLYLNDGRTVQSIVENRLRRWFISQIDTTYFLRSFVVLNPFQREAWVCIPQTGSAGWCTLALVWNYQDNTMTLRDLNQVSCGYPGIPGLTASAVWNDQSDVWDDVDRAWDASQYTAATPSLVLGTYPATGTGKLLQEGQTQQFDGTSYEKYVERTDLSIIGQNYDGTIKSDPTVVKLLAELWPHASGSAFKVRVGSRNVVSDPISWSNEKTFTPGTDQMLTFEVAGALLSWRASSQLDEEFEIQGMDIDVRPMHKYYDG